MRLPELLDVLLVGTTGFTSASTTYTGAGEDWLRSKTYRNPSMVAAANMRGRIGLNRTAVTEENWPLTPVRVYGQEIAHLQIMESTIHIGYTEIQRSNKRNG